MLSPLPRRSGWVDDFARYPSRVSLPRYGCRVGLRIVLFEVCSAFTRVTACTLALSPIRDTHSEGFSYFVTSTAAPVASGWSGCRVGLAPTGKRRLVTAHAKSGHQGRAAIQTESTLRQARLAHPVNPVLGILGVLEDEKTFVSINCEAGVDPQHLRSFGSRLHKLSRLGMGERQKKVRPMQIGHAQGAFPEQAQRLAIALERVIGLAQEICRVDERLKRIEAHVRLQDLDRPCGLARIHQDLSVSIVDEIGVEREGSLEFGDGCVVLVLVKQDMSKLSAGLWQAGVEVHRFRRKLKGAVQRSRTE